MPVALFRIVYGVLIIATLVLLHPDWLNWYGTHAWVSLETARTLEPGVRLNLFAVIPQRDSWIAALFWVFLGSAVLLTLGFLTRFNSLLVYICLTSIHQRNLYINHGGDTFLRVAGFFLIFAPAGAALSVDRLIRVWRGKEDAKIPARAPWAQRMIQVELALMYFATFCWKVQGVPWVKGTALYYVYHLDELQRFYVPPWMLRPTILRIGTWVGLALEFSLGVLVWVKELRYYLLGMGVVFHLWLEYSLNVPMFEWDVLSAYVLFVEPADMARVWKWIRGRVAARLGEEVTVCYDGNSPRLRAQANLLRALDVFRRLKFANSRDSGVTIPAQMDRGRLTVLTRAGARQGFEGVMELAGVVPLLWPLAGVGVVRRLSGLGGKSPGIKRD
ncbi:MAG: HTTM domain-containing protein [Candidatus Acidiferrales bacterium]